MEIKLKYDIKAPYGENLVKERGCGNYDDFLTSKESALSDPFLLTNMDRAVEEIQKVVGKRALCVVDSDCDGYNASAILLQFLQKCYPTWEIEPFIHEHKEHGLEDVVKEKYLEEYEVVFLPDAGSSDDEYIVEAPHVTFFILDHHLRDIEGEVPSNMIIVNNQLSENYPNKDLSGAGVTWQFCRALDLKLHGNTQLSDVYIDQVALTLVSDMMDLTTDENRHILDTGLTQLQNEFFMGLCEKASFKIGGILTPMGVAFYVAPLINAMCRVGNRNEKLRMFTAMYRPEQLVVSQKRGAEKGSLVPVAQEAIRECTNAKARQKRQEEKIADICEKQILEDDLDSNKIIIIDVNEDFEELQPEMNGLVATQLTKRYHKPTLVLRENKNGELRGSARGLENIDMAPLKQFLEESELFEYCQGHDNAFGVSIKKTNKDRLINYANEQLAHLEDDSSLYEVDFLFDGTSEEIGDLVFELDKFSHRWGKGFPEAVIGVKDMVVDRSQIAVMGKTGDTVKITHNGVKYMFFRQDIATVQSLIENQTLRLNLVGTAKVNYFNGIVSPQIFVEDFEILPTEKYIY